jgi:hypothetical protein
MIFPQATWPLRYAPLALLMGALLASPASATVSCPGGPESLAMDVTRPSPEVRRAEVARIVASLDVAGAVEPILGFAVEEISSPASSIPIEAQFEAQLVLEQAFDPQSIEARVIEVFVARYEWRYVLAARAWLESTGGQRLAALDRSEPGTAAIAVAGSAEGLVAREDFAGRHLVLEHIDSVTGHSQAVSRRMRIVLRAMLESASAAMSPGRQIEAETITDLVDREVRRIEDSKLAGGMLSLHHRYSVVSTSELRAYADFVECDAGRWLHGTLNDALDRALHDAGREAGAGLARALAKK